MPKTSVALCTYNGARFIEKQIKSILNQSVAISELIVCDDKSDDDTLAQIAQLTAQAPFTTQIFINEQRLGSTKNFEKALQHCTGDVIFLCDQDDEWPTDKVKNQLNYLEQNPHIDAVFTNAQLIDESSAFQNTATLWDMIQFEDSRKALWCKGLAYQILFEGYVVTGATLAIRKEALRSILPFPLIHTQLIHDGWIALVLALQNKIDFIDECLLFYRIHRQQQVGIGGQQQPVTLKSRLQRARAEKLLPLQHKATYLAKLYDTLHQTPHIDTSKLQHLNIIKTHFETRAYLPSSRLARLRPVWTEFVQKRYQYSSKDWWLPLLGDIFE